jgi:hypothetical protein
MNVLRYGYVRYFNFCSFLQFEVLDWDSDGSHDLIGGFTVSLQDLQSSIGKEVDTVYKIFNSLFIKF